MKFIGYLRAVSFQCGGAIGDAVHATSAGSADDSTVSLSRPILDAIPSVADVGVAATTAAAARPPRPAEHELRHDRRLQRVPLRREHGRERLARIRSLP